MERIRLSAEGREVGRKGMLREARRGGRVPAILYGRGSDPQPITLQEKELTHVLKGAGMNALIDLEVKDRKEKTPLVVMVKELQRNVLSRQITHVDLLKVDMKEKVTVAVAVRLTGKAVGVTKGGLIDQPARELEIRCLPTAIPEGIEGGSSALDIGDSIHLKDLKFPAGDVGSAEGQLPVVSNNDLRQGQVP